MKINTLEPNAEIFSDLRLTAYEDVQATAFLQYC